MGWARANLAYDKAPLPEPGTLTEVVFLMVQHLRVQREVAQTRALAQAGLGGEAAQDAWKNFTDIVYRQANTAQKERMAEALQGVRNMGPIAVRPLSTKKARTTHVVRRKT